MSEPHEPRKAPADSRRSQAGYAIGDRLELIIDRIVPGGMGLGRGPSGVVFVEYSAPADRLVVEIESLRGGVARGRIVSILAASADRVEPPCPWYGRCGGCDLQHLRYDAQLDVKEAIVRDALERIGGIRWNEEIGRFAAPQPFGSRARVELHHNPATNELGFFERRSNRVVDIESCLVSRPEIDDAIGAIRRADGPLPAAIQLVSGPGIVRSEPALPPIEGGSFWLRIGTIEYLVDPGSFFQSSLELLPQLIERVMEPAGKQQSLVWDLFAGAGLFSLPLSRRFTRVLAIDSDRRAVENASASAERNGIENVRFTAEDISQWLSGRKRGRGRPDLIVVDPPRSGLGKELAAALAARNPDRFAYVSCDPSTLARDLRVLTAGDLRIVDIAIFDLFPQTHHVETIVRLARG